MMNQQRLSSSVSEDPPSFQILRIQYLEEVSEQLRTLQADLERGVEDVSNRDPQGRFRKLIHNLKGSGGGYEFPELSERAATLEQGFLGQASAEELHAGLAALIDCVRASHAAAEAAAEIAEETKGSRVLLVDDDRLVAVLVGHALKEHDTEQVGSCAEALLRLSRTPTPDVVLLDQHLPDGFGLELIPPMRALAPNVPILFVSADAERLEESALAAGAAAVLQKPFVVAHLKAVVASVLQA